MVSPAERLIEEGSGRGPLGQRLSLLDASSDPGVGAALRSRSLVFDIIIMVLFAAMGLVLLQVFSPKAQLDDFGFVLLICAPLALRRRYPKTALVLIFGLGALQALLGIPIGLHDGALLFALYSAVGSTERSFALPALAVGLAIVVIGAATGWWKYVDGRFDSPLISAISAVGAATLVLASWALGHRLRSARYGLEALAQRADQLERERDQQAQLAAAAERARIAREMHDVVAHGLSVMIVQADGASYVVQSSPEDAQKALTQIAATGRTALAEMRDLLGLLRAGEADQDHGGVVAPQPALTDLETLAAEARDAGAEVELTVRGPVEQVPAMVALTAYRVVQEALTNARRHGGPRVSVELDVGDDQLSVVVTDSGRPSPTGREPEVDVLTGTPLASGGFGLMGMRERVAAVGGTVRTGLLHSGPSAKQPGEAGEPWRVQAELPLRTALADVPHTEER